MLTAVFTSLRDAARGLRRSPGFTVVAVLSLALGIGAGASIFSLVDALVLRPVPGVADPARVVEVTGESFTYPATRDYIDAVGSARLTGFAPRWVALTTGGEAERVEVVAVTGDYFGVLGVRPARGRALGAADDEPGAPLAIVLSDAASRERFGGAADVVGRTVSLNGQAFTVVGVAPAGFRGTRLGTRPLGWVSVRSWAQVKRGAYVGLDVEGRGWSWLRIAGRLAPDAGPGAVAAEMDAVARREIERFPDAVPPTPPALRVVPIAAAAAGLDGSRALKRFGGVLLAAVGLALLIACANIANLMLARGARRRQELAVRRALGASRRGLALRTLTESSLLAALGVGFGILLATWGVALLAALTLPGGIDVGALGVHVSARVVAVSAAMGAITALLFGSVPALRSGSAPAASALGARGATGGARGARTRGALVATQVALCLVLLAGAALLLRSLGAAMREDPGFDAPRLGVLEVDLGNSGYTPEHVRAYMDAVRGRVASDPGVEATAWISISHLTADENVETFTLDAPGAAGARDVPATEMGLVGPGYFPASGTALLRGRGFDENATEPEAVVSRAFAERFSPGRDPIGRAVFMGPGRATIVGEAEDVALHGPGTVVAPFAYLHVPDATPGGVASLLVRTRGRPDRVLPGIVRTAADVDGTLPIRAVSLAERLRDLLAPQRVAAILFTVFGLLTLALATTGIYGVISYATAQRKQEFGIRVALGASTRAVAAMVVRQGMRAVAAGAAVGLAGAWVAGRTLRSLLYDVAPSDPLALGAAVALLALAAIAALLVPAIRAAAADPAAALREE